MRKVDVSNEQFIGKSINRSLELLAMPLDGIHQVSMSS
jgi:hypothetical protein